MVHYFSLVGTLGPCYVTDAVCNIANAQATRVLDREEKLLILVPRSLTCLAGSGTLTLIYLIRNIVADTPSTILTNYYSLYMVSKAVLTVSLLRLAIVK